MELSEVLKGMMEELKKVLTTEIVVGKPIVIEDKTLIPVIKAGVGLGAGTGGKKKAGETEGGGGGGAGVEPVAFVAVFKGIPGPEGVKVLTLERPSGVAKIIGEAMPVVMEKIKEMREGKKAEGKE